jgi:hypothetical protein
MNIGIGSTRTACLEVQVARLLQVSIGVEGWEDPSDDLLQGFKALAEHKQEA